MYQRRKPTIAIATLLLAGLGALALIPAPQSAVEAKSVIADASRETLAVIDGMLSASAPAQADPSAELAPPSLSEPADRDAPAGGTFQTAALVREIGEPAQEPLPSEEPAQPEPDPALKADAIGASAVNLRAGPSASTATLTVLRPGQSLRTGASDGGWIAVTLDDGTSGWIYSRYLASAAPAPGPEEAPKAELRKANASATTKTDADSLAGRTARIEGRLAVRATPSALGRTLFRTDPGERVRIVGSKGSWLQIRTADGTTGWIQRG